MGEVRAGGGREHGGSYLEGTNVAAVACRDVQVVERSGLEAKLDLAKLYHVTESTTDREQDPCRC